MCPDYEIKCWNESNFNINEHPFVRAAYSAKAWAFVSDYARLKIIYDNGGIYLETDVELLKNLDVLRRYKCYIGVQQSGHLCTTGLGFGAEKANPVVKMMLEKYDSIVFDETKKVNFACPVLNNQVFQSMGYIYNEKKAIEIDGILVLPPKYLDPIAPGSNMKFLKCVDTISIHHYSASWMGKHIRLKRKIIRMIGQNHMCKIKKVIRLFSGI